MMTANASSLRGDDKGGVFQLAFSDQHTAPWEHRWASGCHFHFERKAKSPGLHFPLLQDASNHRLADAHRNQYNFSFNVPCINSRTFHITIVQLKAVFHYADPGCVLLARSGFMNAATIDTARTSTAGYGHQIISLSSDELDDIAGAGCRGRADAIGDGFAAGALGGLLFRVNF